MTARVILNPYANRWRAGARANAVMEALKEAGLPATLTISERPEHAISLARQATEAGYQPIIAAGGDGTINEVINGILQATPGSQPTPPFAIMPIGTANDFARMQGVPLNITLAAQAIASGQTHQIDAGIINGRWQAGPRYFINNSAVAMEPMITLENIRMKRLSGEIRYIVALIKGVLKLKAWQMQIQWDGGGYEGPTYLLSVCNGPRTGGFPIAPGAQVDDGLFDFVFVPEVPKWTVLAILFRLMQGRHIHHPAVTFRRTTQIALSHSSPATPVHADGELFTQAATAVSYHILPHKVTLLGAYHPAQHI